jgi:hypothetical protein
VAAAEQRSAAALREDQRVSRFLGGKTPSHTGVERVRIIRGRGSPVI